MARVLVIEDNPINLELLNYLLQAWQHEVLQAADGSAGLALARRESPDLILCDLQMPGVDGHAVARALRADPQLRKIPLLAVTALARDTDRDAALASGFDGVFTKPIEPAAFMSELQAYLPGPHRPPAPGPAATPAAPTSSSRPLIPDHLRAPRSPCVLLTADDGPSNLTYKRDLLEPAGYTVKTAASVSGALALLQQGPVDGVVSDVVMADGGGFELLRRIQAHADWRRLPFVFLTSSARDPASRELGMALGAKAFLVRPLDALDLLATLRRVLQREGG